MRWTGINAIDRIIDGEVQQAVRGLASRFLPGGDPVPPSSSDAERFMAQIIAAPYGLYPVLGAKGSGKTSWSLALAESIAQYRHVKGLACPLVAVGIKDSLPPHWGHAQPEGLEGLPLHAVVVLDDAGLDFSSRDYHTPASRALREALAVLRHQQQTYIVNSHSSSQLDRYFLEADAIFLKWPSLLFEGTERSALQGKMQESLAAFQSLPKSQWPSHIYAMSITGFQGLIRYDPPPYWGDRLSRNKA